MTWDTVARDDIRLEAAGLVVYQSRRIVCPFCDGGESRERSLSITRAPTGILYNCYRGSCTEGKGFIGEAGAISPLAPTPAKKFEPYAGGTLPLEQVDLDYFYKRFELTAEGPTGPLTKHISRTVDDAYILPIRWLGELIGENVRQPWPGAPRKGVRGAPKSNVYMHKAAPAQASYEGASAWHAKAVVVVEDQLSAIKVAQLERVSHVVSLLGTHMNMEKAREIARLQADEVIIALDANVTATAFMHAREYGLAFKKVRVAILQQDLKDTQLSEIPYILSL